MKKHYKTAAILTCLLCAAAFTSCGTANNSASNAAEENAALTDTVLSEATTEKINVTVGYIKTSEGQEAADLCSEEDENTVIAKMFDNEPISVYSIQSDWAKISYGGQIGYVKAVNVSFTSEKQPDVTTQTQKSAEKATENIKSVDAGDTVNVDGDVNNINGDVNVVFLADVDGFEYANPVYLSDYKQQTARNAWCSTTSCYIYSQPDTNSFKREADMLYYGDELTVEGTVGAYWYYISTDSGNGYDLHGYVKASYITYGQTPAEPENYNASYGVVKVGSANVRSSPNKENSSNILFTVYSGQEFQVLSYDGYWYKVVINGTTGYISHKMVDVW